MGVLVVKVTYGVCAVKVGGKEMVCVCMRTMVVRM